MQALAWHISRSGRARARASPLDELRRLHRPFSLSPTPYAGCTLRAGFAVCYQARRYGAQARSNSDDKLEDSGQDDEQGIKNVLLRDKPVINFYHQDFPWSKRRRRFDPNDSAAADDSGEVRGLELEMKRLDEEIRQMREPGEGKTLIEPLLEGLSPEDQHWLRKDIQKKEWRQAGRVKTFKDLASKLTIVCSLSPHQRPYLDNLNVSVKAALVHCDNLNVRKRIWQSYTKCKVFLPPFLHLIPRETWIVLARTQALAFSENDTNWAMHSIVLFTDMQSVGQKLNEDHHMLFIEALRTENQHEQSIAEWQALGKMIDTDQQSFTDYHRLGCRIHISKGDIKRAHLLATEYLRQASRPEARILLPIMRAWAQRGNELETKYAWFLYHRLRLLLGSQMTAEDYDQIHLDFLRGGSTDLAMVIFRDMMLTGQNSSHDSLEVQRCILPELEERLLTNSDPPDTSHISLTRMTAIPYELNNKFFYSKWIKRLIGMNELTSAMAVVQFMHKHGVTPAAKHLNGIVGGLMRTGNLGAVAQAEAIAWAMINQRTNFVRQRNGLNPMPLPQQVVLNDRRLSIPTLLQGFFPSATVETYSLLLQLYIMQYKYDEVDQMQRARREGEVLANIEFTNQLLHLDLKRQRYSSAWQRYLHTYTDVQRPDLDTFDYLWRCQYAHLVQTPPKLRSTAAFTTPRKLMAEMGKRLETCRESRKQVHMDMTRPMYETILGCFCQDKDFVGILVSIAALQKSFGAYPDNVAVEAITRSLVDHVAHTRTTRSPRRTGRIGRLDKSRQKRAAEAVSKQCIDSTEVAAAERLRQAGCDDIDELPQEQRNQESLVFLMQYVKAMLQHVESKVDLKQELLEAAAEMGQRAIVEGDSVEGFLGHS